MKDEGKERKDSNQWAKQEGLVISQKVEVEQNVDDRIQGTSEPNY